MPRKTTSIHVKHPPTADPTRDPRTPLRRLAAALVGSSLLIGAADAQAIPPSEPIPGISFQANQAYVGDPLRGMEPGQAGNLYGFFEDEAVHMASTTKSFALLVAVEAVESGFVSLDDLVTISAKAAGINDNHDGSGQNQHSNEALVEGIQLRFEDLLYSMIHTSAGDSSIAIAQHVAVSIDPTLANESDAEQEVAFTNRMNARAAELDLDDTVFFNAYGGDHVHMNDNTPGINTDHSASARDMATWFAVGMEIPLFREIVGFSGTWTFGSWNSLHAFSTTGGNSYPGFTGGKGGSGGDGVGGGCGSCAIASADRAGRELITAYTQGQAGDGVTLLDYGFASLFHPTQEATSDAYTDGWQVEDLACLSSSRAVSAIVNGSSQAALLVWGVDVEGGSIAHVNRVDTTFDGVDGLKGTTRDPDGTRDDSLVFTPTTSSLTTTRDTSPISTYTAGFDDPDPTPSFDYKAIDDGRDGGGHLPTGGPEYNVEEGKTPAAFDVRITEAGYGRVVVAEESEEGIKLFLYGIDTDDDPFLMDWDIVGNGTRPRVTRLNLASGQHIVVAHRRPDGFNELNVYRLEPNPGNPSHSLLSNATDTMTFSDTNTLEISHLGDSSSRFVVAAQTLSGKRQSRVYSVHSATGQLDLIDSWTTGGNGSRIDVTHLRGFDTSSYYALAFVNTTGRPAVEVYRVDSSDEIDYLGGTASNEQIAADMTLRIAPYRERSVMLAYQDGLSRRFESWALDESTSGNSVTPEMLTRESAGLQGIHGFCRVPGNDAEGDFLISQGVEASTALRIEAWRSAQRP